MSTPASSYDVVIVGTDLAPLLSGALLAKRGFRVLLLSQETLPPTYEAAEGRRLPRAPFRFEALESPACRRVLSELALNQGFRRRVTSPDPAFQVCMPGVRFDLAATDARLEREIDREFPEVRRPIEDLLRSMQAHDARLDRVLSRDAVWPAQTFFERREHRRATATQPFGRDGTAVDPLAEFPEDHAFRHVVQLPARFADGMDPDHSSGLRTTRLFGACRRSAVFEDNYEGLRQLLLESLETHGAVVREPERIDALRVKRGAVSGVRIAASGTEIGSDWVLFGSPLASLLRLIPDRGPFEELFERIGEPVVRYYRYTLNVLMRAEGVPVGMARDVYFVRDRSRPPVGENALRLQLGPEDGGHRLITVEVLLPRRSIEEVADYTGGLRERLLEGLAELIPFLHSHIALVDSPHDGRGVDDLAAGLGRPSPTPWERGPHTMRAVYGYPVVSGMGVCALPVRAPVKRLLLCNGQVCPGLGLEGAFVTAWSTARVVSRSDRKREWMRRGRWGKLEI